MITDRPMFKTKDMLFWAALALIVTGGWLLLSSALAPFLVGLGMAYVLNPLVVRLRRLGMSRLTAIAVVVVVFFFGLGYLLYRITPYLATQAAGFLRELPAMIQTLQGVIEKVRLAIETRFGISLADASSSISFSQFASTAVDWLTKSLTTVGSTGQAVMTSLEFLIIVPFAVFYFLADWERMVRALQRLIPVSLRHSVFTLTGEIDRMLGGYFRGQSMVCLALGTFYALALWAIGLRYGIVIGVISGVLAFIPYLGTAVCMVLAFGFGIAQFWPEWQMLVVIGVIIGAGQFLEGNILTPQLVGRHVGLHPLALMFGLIALGKLYGFIGVLLSVPITGTIAIMLRRLAASYRRSDFFTKA